MGQILCDYKRNLAVLARICLQLLTAKLRL